MKPTDYRTAACCAHCHYLGKMAIRCVRHGVEVKLDSVCADFATNKEVEGGEDE